MCPQPQAPYDRSEEVIKILRCIPKKMLHKICLTGGEPTLGDQLFKILNLLKKYPYVEPLILTNGRKFSNRDFAKKFVEKAPLNMVYAIPLYSSIPQIHDEIVGISGAFKETIEGIYNLTRFRVPIELRIVLVKKNIFNLKELPGKEPEAAAYQHGEWEQATTPWPKTTTRVVTPEATTTRRLHQA